MKKRTIVIISAIVFSLLSTQSVLASDETTVSVGEYTVPTVGEIVNITVDCTLSQAIKGYELIVYFNPAVVQVNSVSTGTIFDDFEEFHSDGEINNTAGSITKIFGVILGPGNTTQPGDLITISFTTINYGISPILLVDVGLCNESQYIQRTVINGSIRVTQSWDLDGNGVCGSGDLMIILQHWGQKGTPGWIPEDLDLDGKIGIIDAIIIAIHYGETW